MSASYVRKQAAHLEMRALFRTGSRALLISALVALLATACSVFGQQVVLAGRVIDLQGESALVSVHSTANAKPGQTVVVYRIDLKPAVKRPAKPWREPKKTGTAVIEEVIGDHAVRVKMTTGMISTDHDVELRKGR